MMTLAFCCIALTIAIIVLSYEHAKNLERLSNKMLDNYYHHTAALLDRIQTGSAERAAQLEQVRITPVEPPKESPFVDPKDIVGY